MRLENNYALILRIRNPFVSEELRLSNHVIIEEKQQLFHVLYLWDSKLSLGTVLIDAFPNISANGQLF